MSTPQQIHAYIPACHTVQPIPIKAHRVNGFSPEMLERHYEEIYGGAVRRLNAIEERIAAQKNDAASASDIVALRNEAVKVENEIILHEVYFASLCEDGGEEWSCPVLRQAFDTAFGGMEKWQAEFTATAAAVEDRNGWVVLAWSERFGRLVNFSSSPAEPALTGAQPILALDLGEHAYAADFGADRESYVEAFLNNIHWGRVGERFDRATGDKSAPGDPEKAGDTITVGELKAAIDRDPDSLLVLDVRHQDDRERYRSRIMDTGWRDSFHVADWIDELPRDRHVVVYCMYGFWVSQKVAAQLREHGFNARSLSGGVTAWRAMGFPSSENEVGI